MLPKNLKPIYIKKNYLTRIGPKYDGGYVIDKRIINKINTIVTCGLNDDWEFEKHFLKINPEVKILAFDHTVNNKFWIKRFVKDVIHLFFFKKLRWIKIIKIFSFFDYIIFFRKNNKHYKIKIGNKFIKNYQTSINKILKRKKNVLLKIDIEGAEYKILNEIIKNSKKIQCLIIEFHNIQKKQKKISTFIKKLKELKLIHIHGNNYAGLNKYGNPEALELTLINIKNIEFIQKKNLNTYPIKGIDFPNVRRNNDIDLNFYNRN